MPIPKTRDDLVRLITTSFAKLSTELEELDSDAAETPCAEEWTIRELVAVRVWWTEHVVEWIAAGRRGETPALPAAGYTWRETPRLNSDVAKAAAGLRWPALRRRLAAGVERALETVEELTDVELLEAGVFEWAGKWPIARWMSVNTATQYASARTLVRRARR